MSSSPPSNRRVHRRALPERLFKTVLWPVVLVPSLLLATFGCGQGVGLTAQQQAVVQTILTVMQQAPQSIAFEGVRTIETFNTEPVLVHTLHTERVQADGQGGFQIEPLSILDPGALTELEYRLRELSRIGWNYEYRDFRIHDVAQVFENYTIVDFGESSMVAGRSCQRLEVLLQSSASCLRHKIDVDLTTGMVLRHEILDAQSLLSYRSEFQSIEFAPPAQFVPHQPINGQAHFADAAQLEDALGFEFKLPRILPDGYRLDQLSRIVDQTGQAWGMAEYTDGIEMLFFLSTERYPGDPPPNSAGQSVPALGGLTGSLAAHSGEDLTGTKPDLEIGHKIGALSLLQAELGSQRMLAVGRLPMDELRWFVEASVVLH